MSSGQTMVLAAAFGAAALVLVVLLTVLVSARRARRRTDAALAASRAELAAMQERLDALAAQGPGPGAAVEPAPRRRPAEPEFVITTAGAPGAGPVVVPGPPTVDARQFASVAVGESLVRLVSLAYGVRRALSAENRNRIAFEMRREVRRSRKDRRRELRDLRRRLRDEPDQPPQTGEHAA